MNTAARGATTGGVWFRVEGDGPTIVLTHGWGATADMWEPQVEALRTRARVVTWDLRGHGRSASPDDARAYSAGAALADLEALVGDGPAVLCGHSLGGQLSLAFALRHPRLVAGLGLLSTGPGYRDAAARDTWNAGIERQARALERRGLEALPAGDDLHGGRHAASLPPAEGARRATALAHAIRGFVTQHDSAIMDGLARITVPTFVVVGDKDRGFLDAAAYFEHKIAGATRVVVPDAGHAVNRHQPRIVNTALVALLDATLTA